METAILRREKNEDENFNEPTEPMTDVRTGDKDPKRWKKLAGRAGLAIGIVIVGFVAMTVLGSAEKESAKSEYKPEPRAVRVQTLDYGDRRLMIEGSGAVNATRTLEVVSEVSGKAIYAKNNLKDGSYARQGELLVRVFSEDVANQIAGMRAAFMNSVANLLPELKIENEEAYERWRAYFDKLTVDAPLPPLPETTSAREKIRVSSKNVFTQYYDVKNREILLSKYDIRAPFSGYIESATVITDGYVSPGKRLFTLVDAGNVEASVPLLVRDFQLIDFSRTPRVKLYSERSDHSIWGTIVRKGAYLDPNSQMIDVFVKFRNPNNLADFLPGNYVRAEIEGAEVEDVAAVPRRLVDDEGYIHTMEDGALARRKVEIVARQGDKLIIRKTFPEDIPIVTTVLPKPILGMPLKAIDEPTNEPTTETDEMTTTPPREERTSENEKQSD
ncbi:MAG: HlyD family efflux transporter periplasmic adaptor subunit [Ignavibacteriales bacterium]|nr:HlyD family efflux transporter periplasmic adaptor subunit [Ignavibacteriales bacterium]